MNLTYSNLKIKNDDFVVINKIDFEKLLKRLDNLETLFANTDISKKQNITYNNEETFPQSLIDKFESNESMIKIFRNYRNMTQNELCKKSGVSISYLRKLEAGHHNCSIDILKKIAKALKVDVDYFLD